ncbi:unnamed protein product [Ostreobium quekettii]|uniref:Uncharacterized protein n=1 Tax=Ostreobium quekettii TaxID=121088 RepID=A0A8S1J0U3_9CHLO|nr:unnamed protein product [Ostreobium quekettii]|eukprot:evm.model.scf_258.4 EVM.evm.TU.scf_258.4   scf_258:58862-63127(-)
MATDLHRRLLAKYVPEIRLHSRERYFPTSVETFLGVAELRKLSHDLKRQGPEPLTHDVLVETGKLTRENLMAAAAEHDKGVLQLVVHEGDRAKATLSDLPEVPIYGHVREVKAANGSVEALEVVYAFFFIFNGNLRVARVLEAGQHIADWEHLTVRLDPSGELQGMYYSAHRTIDGDWVPASKIPMSKGRPVTYCALNGHGCYPKPGVQPRIFYLVNDHCDGKGPVWRPKKVVLLSSLAPTVPTVGSRGSALPKNPRGSASDADEDVQVDENVPYWVDFHGWWGAVSNPSIQKWFKEAENPVTRGWFLRVFFPTCCDPPDFI